MTEVLSTAHAFTGKYTKSIKGERAGIVRISHKTESTKDEEVPACQYLHLQSKHNTLASALNRYVKLHYHANLVQGSREWDNFAPLRSFLAMIDNVPENYTINDFRNELVEMLVNQVEYIYPQLKPQLAKSSRSYQQLCIDLMKDKHFHSGIDFYMAAARLFIGHPVSLIKARKNTTPDVGTTGPEYLIERHYFLDGDERLDEAGKVQLRFAFNGIDYYAPFLPDLVGNLYREGVPVLKDIQYAYEDISRIAQKLPPRKSINAGIHLIQLHLQAAAAIAKTTRFTCGVSDPDVTDQPAPTFDPLAAGVVTRKRRIEVVDPEKEEVKKHKKPTTQVVSLDTHISEMDMAAEAASEHLAAQKKAKHQTGDDGGEEEEDDDDDDEEEEEAEDGDGTQKYLIERQPVTDPGPTQCHCGLNFQNKDALRIHKGAVHSNNNYICKGQRLMEDNSLHPCDLEFDTPGGAWRHYRTQHLDIWYYYCPVKDCNWNKQRKGPYGADSELAVKKHMVSRHNLKSDIKCTLCDYVAGSKARLREHIARHSAKTIKFLKCDQCDKGFRSKDKIRVHKKQDHPQVPGDKSGWFLCQQCPKEFRTSTGLKKHIKTIHLPAVPQ